MSCPYKQIAKCRTCTCDKPQACSIFVVVHAKLLSQELLPFKYNSNVSVESKVMWSRSESVAKSIALKYALKKGSKIKKLTLNQVMSIILTNLDFDYSIVYIECPSKVLADSDKVKSVLSTFVDRTLLTGGRVSIWCSQTSCLSLDYNKA